jgi:hypothetical protein
MQPVTQIRLDPTEHHIRHLQAEQEFGGVVCCFGLTPRKPMETPSAWLKQTLCTGSVPQFDVPIGIRHRPGDVATCRRLAGLDSLRVKSWQA